MKSDPKILDTLWEYIETFNPYASEEEKAILIVVAEKSEKLSKSLTADQALIFEDYHGSLSELHSIERKEAFIKGVRFTTQFLLDATNDR